MLVRVGVLNNRLIYWNGNSHHRQHNKETRNIPFTTLAQLITLQAPILI